jgi:hypothetical protein
MSRNRTLVCLRNYRWKRLYLLLDVFILFPLAGLTELLRSRRRWDALRWLLDARIASLRESRLILREHEEEMD